VSDHPDLEVEIPLGHAVVIYEALKRFHESGTDTFVTDGAEWYALVQFLGALQRALHSRELDGDWEWQPVLNAARDELGSYDGIPF
jgi:hypothetical protein